MRTLSFEAEQMTKAKQETVPATVRSQSYVDFRRISTVCPEWVDTATRLASLEAVACQSMLLELFRYLASVELKPEIFAQP
jgi:hypothetical protein